MSNSSVNNSILVSVAVFDELTGIIDAMEKPVNLKTGGREVFAGTIQGKKVIGVITGAGVVNTAQALTSCIETHEPSLIIQTGCAGVFRETGAGIGDICVADSEVDIHTGIETIRTDGGFIADNLPFHLISNDKNKIKNHYPLDKNLSGKAFNAISASLKNQPNGVYCGPFITVSTITATDQRAQLLYDVYGAYMESMEGAAAAHVAALYKIPFVEIRAASNHVGKRDKSKWDLPLAFRQCSKATLACIASIDL